MKRVILPAEGRVEMLAAFWRQKNCGSQEPGMCGDEMSDFDAYRAMRDASPNAGRVTEAELEAMAAECEAVLFQRPNNGRFNPRMAVALRAALASLSLEVEG